MMAAGSSGTMASALIQYLIHATPERSNDSASGAPEVQLVCGVGDVRVVVDVTPSVVTTKMATVTADGVTRWRRVT